MTMTLTRPATTREAELAERDRERQAVNRNRRLRVELLSLPVCPSCEGTTLAPADERLSGVVDVEELLCVCAVRRTQLADRLRGILADRGLDQPLDFDATG